MKIKYLLVLFMISIFSCKKDVKTTTLEDFCRDKPDGWNCEIIEDNFDINDIPKNAGNPVAIIKYTNPNREFSSYTGTKVNPSLTLNFYPVKQKSELIEFIKSQRMYSWCIPMYYGETENYFILTSPCFINSGSFTDEANSSIIDLQNSLKSIMTINHYDVLGN